MTATPEMTNVLRFMELRAPYSPPGKALRQNYIHDDVVSLCGVKPCRIDADLQTAGSASAIGKLVYEHVFCKSNSGSIELDIANLLIAVFGLLTPYRPFCTAPLTFAGETGEMKPLSIFELERRAHINYEGAYYLLPERLEQIEGLKLFPQLQQAFEVMEKARITFSVAKLVKDLEFVFDKRALQEVVFQKGAYTSDFRDAKRVLFDTLYLLYIMRRLVSVNLENIIDGLRVLHVIEALAIDNLFEILKTGQHYQSDRFLRTMLESLLPELQAWNWKGSDVLPDIPLIQTQADFEAYLTAKPVIHPIFSRLHWYKRPFNDLHSIGIGDLKVVKQWLIAYLPGEIAHIENVLKGEIKDRTHRRLEKTEETFSFSSDSTQETQKDTQTTDRFELKQECENIVKTELGLGANANITYNSPGGTVVANVGANFSYKRDSTEQGKTSGTFLHETLTKAIERVQTRTTEQRSVTKLFETEETNKHSFNNKEGKGHVSGIYRWLDKKYKAQLFNYGKRMMFEFMIPEPAAFFIESRLREFEATFDCPQPWPKPDVKTVSLDFTAAQIDETRFKLLQQQYDLSEFSYPLAFKSIYLTDAENHVSFSMKDLPDKEWSAIALHAKIDFKGYQITLVELGGWLEFHSKLRTDPGERNLLQVELEHEALGEQNLNSVHNWNFDARMDNERLFDLTASPVVLSTDEVSAVVRLQCIWKISSLTFRFELSPSPDYITSWQLAVFNKILKIEQQKVDKENQEAELEYNSRRATYRNRLDELKAQSVKELLQGQSEAFNREIIRTELKKHCLTLLTKEFDANPGDDWIGKIDAMQDVLDDFIYHKIKVTEVLNPPKPKETEGSDPPKPKTTFTFEKIPEKGIKYPSIALKEAKMKGRYIQFLEQAFEWQQLGYIFYPYFWATRPKWIEKMNHTDDTDPNMTAFLQAGSVKVLIAVTPAYEHAVCHFLATREPWEGGPAPVIGDPLFIPLHEELRKQQDDLYNAVAEGEPWTFVLPTSLVYLEDSSTELPKFPDRTD
jgi:hypothetical protein